MILFFKLFLGLVVVNIILLLVRFVSASTRS